MNPAKRPLAILRLRVVVLVVLIGSRDEDSPKSE
jgi:hypothetical protein